MKAILVSLALPAAALAQNAMPTEFPADTNPVAAQALQERVAGKSFSAQPFTGPSWRLQYQPSGYVFFDTNTGYRDKGRWRVDDTRLCAEWEKLPSACSEVRVNAEALFVKRSSNGEVVKFVPRRRGDRAVVTQRGGPNVRSGLSARA